MPKQNIDQLVNITEPIEIILEGKDYTIPDMKFDRLKRATEISQILDRDSDYYDPDASLEEVYTQQLSILTGADAEEFRQVDARKCAAAINFIMGQLAEQRNRAQRRQSRKR